MDLPISGEFSVGLGARSAGGECWLIKLCITWGLLKNCGLGLWSNYFCFWGRGRRNDCGTLSGGVCCFISDFPIEWIKWSVPRFNPNVFLEILYSLTKDGLAPLGLCSAAKSTAAAAAAPAEEEVPSLTACFCGRQRPANNLTAWSVHTSKG